MDFATKEIIKKKQCNLSILNHYICITGNKNPQA